MSKYLLFTVHAEKLGETPDVFILPATASLFTELQNKLHITKSAYTADASLKGIAFNFDRGYWINTGDPDWVNRVIGEKEITCVEINLMAVVGADVSQATVTVDPHGSVYFEGWDDETETDLYTEGFKLADIAKEMGL